MPWHWIAFFALVLVLLAIDLGVFHREAHVVSTREAVGWTSVWVSLGLSFSGVVYLLYSNHWFGVGVESGLSGADAVWLYLTGYLIEESLSIDNIFVISLIITSMRVKPEYQHRVLFWGILGALVFRGIMIFAGVVLVKKFTWIFYIFGAILIFSGLKMLREEEEQEHAEDSSFLRLARRILPMAKGEHPGHFTAREDGKRVFTQLAVALMAIELTDIVFAVDSVPAVLSITTDPFLVTTSNVFAILGLRSLYFVLAGMMRTFHYLKYALSLLLVAIGVKLFVHSWVHVPPFLSLAAVVAIVGGGIVLSVLFGGKDEPGEG